MWIARDKNGLLAIYKQKPNKYKSLGQWGNMENPISYACVDDAILDLFPEIKWEDEEPRELVLKLINEQI